MATELYQLPQLTETTAERIIFNRLADHIDLLLSAVAFFQVDDPPISPPNGYKAIISDSPTGVFTPYANHIVIVLSGQYVFIPPNEAIVPQVSPDPSVSYKWDGFNWQVLRLGFSGGLIGSSVTALDVTLTNVQPPIGADWAPLAFDYYRHTVADFTLAAATLISADDPNFFYVDTVPAAGTYYYRRVAKTQTGQIAATPEITVVV